MVRGKAQCHGVLTMKICRHTRSRFVTLRSVASLKVDGNASYWKLVDSSVVQRVCKRGLDAAIPVSSAGKEH
jgi:hypothetical protein